MLLLGCLVLLAGAAQRRGEPPCLAGLLTFAIVAQGAIVRDGGAEEAKTHSVEEARTYAAVADRAAETSRQEAKDSDRPLGGKKPTPVDDSGCFVGEWKHLATDLEGLGSYLKNVANQGWFVIKGAKSAFPSNKWEQLEDGRLQVNIKISVAGFNRDDLEVMPAAGAPEVGEGKIGKWSVTKSTTVEWQELEPQSFAPVAGAPKATQKVLVTTVTVTECPSEKKIEGLRFVTHRWVDEADHLHQASFVELAPGQVERFERIFERKSPSPDGRASCRAGDDANDDANDDAKPAASKGKRVEDMLAQATQLKAAGKRAPEKKREARSDAEDDPAKPRGCGAGEVCCKGGRSSSFFKGGWGKGAHGFYRCVAGTDKRACESAKDEAERKMRLKDRSKCDPTEQQLADYRHALSVRANFEAQRAEAAARMAAQRQAEGLAPAPDGVPEVLGAGEAFDPAVKVRPARKKEVRALQRRFLTDAATADPASGADVVDDAMERAACEYEYHPDRLSRWRAGAAKAVGAARDTVRVVRRGLAALREWLRSAAGRCWRRVWNWNDKKANQDAREVAIGHVARAVSTS